MLLVSWTFMNLDGWWISTSKLKGFVDLMNVAIQPSHTHKLSHTEQVFDRPLIRQQ